MRVSVARFRKNFLKLIQTVIAGEAVEFVYRGAIIRLAVAEGRSSRLDGLTPSHISNPQAIEEAERKLQEEMFAEMAREWAEI